MRHRWAGCGMAVAVLWAGSAAAEEPAAGRPAARKWSLSVSLGYSSGGPAGSMEAAMRSAGLTDSQQGFGMTLTSPSSGEGGFVTSASLSYALRPRWEVKVLTARRLELGETIGYSGPPECCPPDEPSASLFTDYSVRTTAALLVFKAGPLRVGAGPSLNAVSVESFEEVGRHRSDSGSRPGLVVEGGLAFPERSRLFLSLEAQHRYVTPFKAGSFRAVDGRSGRVLATVAPARLSFGHGVVAAGLGVRF
jgi:hypothetical protein